MDKLEALDNLGKLVEKDLVRNLKLIREGSYGILSSTVKEREISKFKSHTLKKELVSRSSDEEVNIIIEYILLRNGIRVNERELNKLSELDER